MPALEGSGEAGGFSPADLKSAYDLPSSTGVSATIVIVIAYDDPNAESDLATYRLKYGLSACTTASGCFSKVNWKGEVGNYPVPNREWAEEESLDLDMVSAACPACKIKVIEAQDNETSSLYPAVELAATTTKGVTIVSDSWRSDEEEGNPSENHYFNHPAVPILFASGDRGYGVGYPAASPYVISVGGTHLTKSSTARGWTETAWSGAGSGCSKYEPKPAWQSDGRCSGRTVADVSAVADPNTPVSVYDSYELPGWTLVGGTSAATPFIAGFEALTNEEFRTGGAASFRYAGEGGLLNDPVSGENGGFCGDYLCQAESGYDGPTGWGTPETVTSCLCNPSETTNDAYALRPPVTAEHYQSTGASTIELSALIDTEGLETSLQIEYGQGENGTTYSHSATCGSGKLLGKGDTYVPATCSLTLASQGSSFHYRVVAENPNGRHAGPDRPFTTATPAVSTEDATKVESTRAVLNGTINPDETVNGGKLAEGPATRYYFEFGTSPTFGLIAPLRPAQLSKGQGTTAVSTAVDHLTPKTIYRYRVVAENGNGPAQYGAERVLVTHNAEWLESPLPKGVEGVESSQVNSQTSANSVACPSTSECIAVGRYYRGGAYKTYVPSAERRVAGAWQSMSIAPPASLVGGSSGTRAVLNGISCSSAVSCTAVGDIEHKKVPTEPLVEHWNGSTWTAQTAVKPTGAVEMALAGVSCPTSGSLCQAVGFYRKEGGQDLTLVETWSGSSWTVPSTPNSAGQNSLKGISCVTTAFCVAVGARSAAAYPQGEGFALKWTGTSWSSLETAKLGVGSTFNGVSCVSTTYCQVVGSKWVSGVSSALAEVWVGSSWTVETLPQPEDYGPPVGGATLSSVACVNASSCSAAGTYSVGTVRELPPGVGGTGFVEPMLERESGGSWSLANPAQTSPRTGIVFSAISCQEPLSCVAVGTGNVPSEAEPGLVEPGAFVQETVPKVKTNTDYVNELFPTEARLHASVELFPGYLVTGVLYVEWGTTTSYGNKRMVLEVVNGEGSHFGKIVATGLTAKTVYHYRGMFESAGVRTFGEDKTFTTASP